MNKFMHVFIGSLLVGNVLLVEAERSLWLDFDEIEEHMNKQLKEMRKNIKSLSKLPKNSLTTSLKEDDKNVVITIGGIETQELDAKLNDANDQLSIVTPTSRIVIHVIGNIVEVETSHEIKDVKKEDKDKKTSSQYVGSSSYIHTQQTVSSPLLLEKQTTDYDQDRKELIITIPKGNVQKGRSVSINKIGKQKSETTSKNNSNTPLVEK